MQKHAQMAIEAPIISDTRAAIATRVNCVFECHHRGIWQARGDKRRVVLCCSSLCSCAGNVLPTTKRVHIQGLVSPLQFRLVGLQALAIQFWSPSWLSVELEGPPITQTNLWQVARNIFVNRDLLYHVSYKIDYKYQSIALL